MCGIQPGTRPEFGDIKMKTIRVFLGILTVTLTLSTQVHAQAPFTNSLVAYYPFNGGVVVTDESGNGNDGEIVGNDWRFGLDRLGTESALYLNTTDPINNDVGTYVEAPQSTGLDFNQDFTLSVWINIPDGLPAYHVHNLVSDGPDSSSANFRIISNAETNGDDYLQFTGHPTGGDGDIHTFGSDKECMVASGCGALWKHCEFISKWCSGDKLVGDDAIDKWPRNLARQYAFNNQRNAEPW